MDERILKWLYDVKLSIDEIDSFFEGQERNLFKYKNSLILKRAVERNLEIIGEAINRIKQRDPEFLKKISELSPQAYKNEFERLAIDLSWKSSQIEGNTYSLLETERLLKEKQTASGKTKDEAVMLLNHKKALDFIIENPDFLTPLTIATLESIHSILIQELSIEKNMLI